MSKFTLWFESQIQNEIETAEYNFEKVTKDEIASRLGISKQYLNNILKNKYMPSSEKLFTILQSFSRKAFSISKYNKADDSFIIKGFEEYLNSILPVALKEYEVKLVARTPPWNPVEDSYKSKSFLLKLAFEEKHDEFTNYLSQTLSKITKRSEYALLKLNLTNDIISSYVFNKDNSLSNFSAMLTNFDFIISGKRDIKKLVTNSLLNKKSNNKTTAKKFPARVVSLVGVDVLLKEYFFNKLPDRIQIVETEIRKNINARIEKNLIFAGENKILSFDESQAHVDYLSFKTKDESHIFLGVSQKNSRLINEKTGREITNKKYLEILVKDASYSMLRYLEGKSFKNI